VNYTCVNCTVAIPSHGMCATCSRAYGIGRQEAVEAAACIADRNDQSAWGIAREIRALGIPLAPWTPGPVASTNAAWCAKVLRSKGWCGHITVEGEPPREVGCILPIGHDDGVHEALQEAKKEMVKP
jgi:hypothetical protein